MREDRVRAEQFFVAFAKFSVRWISRFRRAHKGSPGKAGGVPPEPLPCGQESSRDVPVVQVPAPDVLAFGAVAI